MKVHELKTWPKYFEAISENRKQFEVRKDDRGFQVGDVLHLKEWNEIQEIYTGMELLVQVSYILKGGQFGIEEGFCVMGIKLLK